MKIAAIFTIPLFWGIVSASPPFREINGKPVGLSNLDNQEQQNKKIPDLEAIIPSKGESDKDDWKNKVWKRSIFPLFQKDSIPILNKDGEDKKDLGLVLNGLKIGKKIVDHALQALAKLVQKSDGDKSSLKSDELDKLTEILPENKPHEVKKRENVKLLNVGGKNVEAGKKNVNKSLRKASEQIENQKKAAAKKQEIFNSIPTITVHKELKNTKSDDKKNDNASPVNKQKRSNAEELTNVQRNKRGTSMSLWNTSDNDSEESNDVVSHSHVSAVLKNRYASVAEAINSGLAIQKIIQRANANVAEAQKVDDDFEIDLHNEFTKWLDDSLEYGLDSEQHIDQHLPSHPPIPKQQDEQIHESAFRSHARSSSNAQATASEHNVPVIKPHDYENSDLRWQYNNNPEYDNQHYPKWMWQNRHFDAEKNDHDRDLHDHSIRSHKLGESEHGPNENIKNIHWQNNVETTYGGHNMYGWKNQDEYREKSGVPTASAIASSSAETKTAAGATQEGTFTPSTWFIKDKHSSSNDNGMPITWTKAGTSITNQGSWNNADSSAIASASTSTRNNARNNAHGYQRFLSNEWLVNEEIENTDHYDIPNFETKISGVEDHSFLKNTYEPSVLTLEDEIENAEILTKSKAKASAQSGSEKSWNRKDFVSDGPNKSTATNTAIRTAVGEEHKSSEMIAKEMIATEKDEAKTYAESTAKATSAAKSVTTIENKNKETGGSATVISESASVATNTPSSSVKKLTTIPNEWLIEEKIVSDVHKTKSDGVTTPSSSTSAGSTSASKDRHGSSILSVKKTRSNKGDAISGARINADTIASSSASASVSASTSASAETSKQSKDTTPEKIVTEEKSQNGDNTVASGHSLASNSGTAATNEEKHREPQWSNKDKPLQKGTDSKASVVRDEPSVSSKWLAKHPIASNIHVTMPGDASSMSSTTFAEPSTINKKKQNSQNTKHETTSGKTITSDNRTNVKDSAIRVVEALREDKKEVPQKKVNIHNSGFGIANHEMRIPPDWLAKRGKGNFYDTELQWHDKNTLGSNTNIPMWHDTSSSSQTTDVGAGSSSEILQELPTSSSIDATINDNESGLASVNTNVKTSAEASSFGENIQQSSTLNWKDTNINEQGDTILDRMTSAKASAKATAKAIANANGGGLKQGKEKEHQKIVDSKPSWAAADSATFASGNTLTAVNRGSSGIQTTQWPSNEKITKEDDNGASFARENAEAITEANAKSTRENNNKSQHNEGPTRTYGDDSPKKGENVQSDWHPTNMLTISDSKSGDNLGDNIRQAQWSESKTNVEDDNTALSAVEGNAASIAEASATSHDEGYAETSQHRLEDNIVENGNVAIDSALSSGHADSIIRDNTVDTHEQSRWNMKEEQLKRDDNAVILSLSNAEAGVTSPKEDNKESTEKSYTSLDRRAETIASASSSASADTALSDNSNDKNKQSQGITEEENVDAVAEIANISEIDDRVESNGKELKEYTKVDEDDAAAVATASSSAHADSVVSDSGNNDHRQSRWEMKEQNSKPDDNAISISTSNAHALAEAGATSRKEDEEAQSKKVMIHDTKLDSSDSVAVATASGEANAVSAVDNSSDDNNKQSQLITKEEKADAVVGVDSRSESNNEVDEYTETLKKSTDLGGAAASSSAQADSIIGDVGGDDQGQSRWLMYKQDSKHDDSAVSVSTSNAHAAAKADSTSPKEDKDNKSGEDLGNRHTLDSSDSVAIASASASASADSAVNENSDHKDQQSQSLTKEENPNALVKAGTTSANIYKPETNMKEQKTSSDLAGEDAAAAAAASSDAHADSEIANSDSDVNRQLGWIMNEQDSKHDDVVAKADVTSPQEVKSNKSGEDLRYDNTLNDGDSVAAAFASASANADAAVNDHSEDKNKESRPIAKEKHTNAISEANTISESTDKPGANEKELNQSADLDEDNATAVAAASSSAQVDSTVSESGDNSGEQSGWKINEQDTKHDNSADSVSTSTAEAVSKADATSQQEDTGDKSERRLKDDYTLRDGDPVAESSASASANADAVVNDHSDDENKESRPIANEKQTDAHVEADTISKSNHKPEANEKELNRSTHLDEDNATAVAAASSSAQADSTISDSGGNGDEQSGWKMNEQDTKHDNSADSVSASTAEAVAKADATSQQEDTGDKSERRLNDDYTLRDGDPVAESSASASANADAAVNDNSADNNKEFRPIGKEKHTDAHVEADTISESIHKPEANEKEINNSADLHEVDATAAATASSSAHADSEVGDSNSDDDRQLRWKINEQHSVQDDSADSLATSNAEAVAKADSTSPQEVKGDKSGKELGNYHTSDGNDSVAVASASSSASSDAAVNDNSDYKDKQSQLITKETNADTLADAGTTSERKNKVETNEKKLKKSVDLDESDTTAVATASSSAHAGRIIDDSDSDNKSQLRWEIQQENPKHDDSSASLSTSNAEADIKEGAPSLGEDKEDKTKNGYAKFRGSDADAIASTSASTNANSAVGDNSDDNHKQSQLITTAETSDSVTEAGANWLNEDKVDKSGKDLGNYATLDGKDSVADASASASASADSTNNDNSDDKDKQSQTLTKEENADALAEARTASESKSKVEANEKELKKSAALNEDDAAALTSESALSNTDFVLNDITDNNPEQSKWITMEKSKKSEDREIPVAEENTDAGAEAVDLSLTGHKWEQSKTDLRDYSSFGNSDSVAVASASANSDSVANDNTVDEQSQSQLTTTDKSANTVADAGATFIEDERTKKTETSLEKHDTLDGNDSITVTSTSASAHADSAVDDNSDNNSNQSEWMTAAINKKHHDRVIPITEENGDAVTAVEPSATSRTQNMNEESKTSLLDHKKLDDSDSIAVALESVLDSANSAVDDNRNDKHKQSQLKTYEKNTNTDVEAATSSQSANSVAVINKKLNKGADVEEDNANAVATGSSSAHADSVVRDNGSNDDGQSKWKMNEQDTKHDDSADSVSTSNAEAVAKEDATSPQEVEGNKLGKELGNYHTLDGGDSVAGASASSKASSDAAVNDNSEDKNKESRPIAKEKHTNAISEADTISESTDNPEANEKELNKSANLDDEHAIAVAAASSSAQADSTISDSGGNGDEQSGWKMNEQDSEHNDSVDSVSTSTAEAVAKADATSQQEDIGDKSQKRLKYDNTLHGGDSVAEASASASANADIAVNDNSYGKDKQSQPIAKEANVDTYVESDTISESIDKPEANKKELKGGSNMGGEDAAAVAAASSSAHADSVASNSGGNDERQSGWKMNEQDSENDNSAASISTSNAQAVAKADASSLQEDNVDKSGKDLGDYHTWVVSDSAAGASASTSASADSAVNDNVGGKDKQSQPTAKEKHIDAHVEADTISESIHKPKANEKELKKGLDMGEEDTAAVATASSSTHADSIVGGSDSDGHRQSRWKMNEQDSKHDDSAVSVPQSNAEAFAKAGAASYVERNHGHSKEDLGDSTGVDDYNSVAYTSETESAVANSEVSAVTGENHRQPEHSTHMGLENDYSGFESPAEEHTHVTSEADTTVLRIDDARGLQDGSEEISNSKASSSVTSKLGDDTTSKENNKPFDLMNVQDYNNLLSDLTESSSDASNSREGSTTLSSEKYDDSIVTAGAIASATAASDAYSSTKDNDDNIILNNKDIEHNVEATRFDSSNKAETFNKKNTERPIGSIEDMGSLDYGSDDSIAVAKTAPVSVYKYILSKGEASDDKSEERKHAQSGSTETGSTDINRDKLVNENVDYNAKDDNLITDAKATASAEVTPLAEAEADSVSANESKDKQNVYFENINTAADLITNDGGSSRIENTNPTISSWKEKEDMSTRQNTNADSSANTQANNMDNISNEVKEDGWLIKWKLNDHSVPITAINKDGAREISQKVGPIIPSSTMMTDPTIEKNSSENIDKLKKADLIVMRKQYGHHKPMSITYIRNSVPPMVVYRVIPKSVYEQVRELITQGNIVHTSYGLPQISKA